MGLDHFDVVHITLPIFYDTIVITWQQPHIIMTPLHCAHSTVVCLKEERNLCIDCSLLCNH